MYLCVKFKYENFMVILPVLHFEKIRMKTNYLWVKTFCNVLKSIDQNTEIKGIFKKIYIIFKTL